MFSLQHNHDFEQRNIIDSPRYSLCFDQIKSLNNAVFNHSGVLFSSFDALEVFEPL